LPVNRFVYDTPWPSYALAWSMRPDRKFRFAVGSCMRHDVNKIQVVDLSEETRRFESTFVAETTLPQTKLMFVPDVASSSRTNLLASTDTQLNLWKVDEDNNVKLIAKLSDMRSQGHLPPLTSFDWSAVNNHRIGTCSVDTTCTIWNLEKQRMEIQLIAHDTAVHDIAFPQSGDDLFVSVGADGSLRLFDQRNLDSSVIIYETSPPSPLLRLAWNKINTHQIATISQDSPGVILVDIRRPSFAVATYSADSCINHIAWAPHTRNHLLCGSESGTAIIWDTSDAERSTSRPPLQSPFLSYETNHEISQVQWPLSQPDYVALGMTKRVEVLQA